MNIGKVSKASFNAAQARSGPGESSTVLYKSIYGEHCQPIIPSLLSDEIIGNIGNFKGGPHGPPGEK